MAVINVVPQSAVAYRDPKESIPHVAYDSELLQTGAAGRLINLFKNQTEPSGVPKSQYMTNYKTPGIFNRPEIMDVHAMGVAIWPAVGTGATSVTTGAIAEVIGIVEDSNLKFSIGTKLYWDGPIHRLPGGVGIYSILNQDSGASFLLDQVAQIGMPMARGVYPQKFVNRINWSEPHETNIQIGHNLPASFAQLGTAPRLFMFLFGVKHRGIQ